MRNVLQPLLRAIRLKDKQLALEWSQSEQWATVEQLIASQKPDDSSAMIQTRAGGNQGSGNRHSTILIDENHQLTSDSLVTGGSGSGGGARDIFPDEEEGFMGTARSWMQSAGTKLAEVEAEVWKRINDAHGK